MQYIVIAIVVLMVVAAVVWPLIRRTPLPAEVTDDTALERRIRRYRAALNAGTVCSRCLRDNPDGSKYCIECGKRL